MSRKLINLVGIPFFTGLLFVFECTDPKYYASELVWSFCISVLLWFGNSFLIHGLDKIIPWRNPAAPRIFIQLGLSTLMTAWITYFALQVLYALVYDVHFSNMVFRRGLFLFLIISWLYNAIYTGNHFFVQWRKSIVEAEELKRQNLISQYESLKAQINPHFLFNSINTMIGLIDEDKDLAKEYGHYFAKVYRYVLDKGDLELINLEEELKVIQIQKKLFEARFGEGIKLQVDVDHTYMKKQIPPLSIQMLIENAVKHNSNSIKKPLLIEITAFNDDTIEVKNNLQRKNDSGSTQVGIENIKSRYALLTDQPVVIEEDSHFVVKLPLLDQNQPE